MLGPLGSDATDGVPNLSPAGPVVSGGLRRQLAEALRRPSKEIGETKCGK